MERTTDLAHQSGEQTKKPRARALPASREVWGLPEWDCFLSVKSVDRIEVTRKPRESTAATIALAGLGR